MFVDIIFKVRTYPYTSNNMATTIVIGILWNLLCLPLLYALLTFHYRSFILFQKYILTAFIYLSMGKISLFPSNDFRVFLLSRTRHTILDCLLNAFFKYIFSAFSVSIATSDLLSNCHNFSIFVIFTGTVTLGSFCWFVYSYIVKAQNNVWQQLLHKYFLSE